jgi:ABC-2 type transport system ATP-binding protein
LLRISFAASNERHRKPLVAEGVTFDGDASVAADAARLMEGVSNAEARGPLLRVFSKRGGELIPALINAGETHGRIVRDIHLSRPSLETLFISLTGRKLT